MHTVRLSKLHTACRLRTDTLNSNSKAGRETFIARRRGKENECLKPR
jgi:hypothetical protein